MSRASLWTALRVVYGFVQAKAPSKVRSSSYDCPSSSMLWLPLFLYAMLLGFLGTVNSSSSVTVGGSLGLVAQAIEHFDILLIIPPSLGAKLENYYTAI